MAERAPRRVTVTMKGLVWKDESEDGYRLFSSNTPLGDFCYGTDRRGVSYHQAPSPSSDRGRDHPNEEAARSAAEAIYEEMVVNLLSQHCVIEP